MKKISHAAVPLLAVFCALPVPAAALNYDYIEGGYVRLDDESGNDEDGARIKGSFDFIPNFALFGEYADTGPFEQATAGVLYHTAVTNLVDFNLGLSVEQAEFGNIDDTGFGARAGLRWQVASNGLEIMPEVRYLDVFENSSTSARLGALMPLGPQFGVVAAVQGGDDDRVELGLRYDFSPRNVSTQ